MANTICYKRNKPVIQRIKYILCRAQNSDLSDRLHNPPFEQPGKKDCVTSRSGVKNPNLSVHPWTDSLKSQQIDFLLQFLVCFLYFFICLLLPVHTWRNESPWQVQLQDRFWLFPKNDGTDGDKTPRASTKPRFWQAWHAQFSSTYARTSDIFGRSLASRPLVNGNEGSGYENEAYCQRFMWNWV